MLRTNDALRSGYELTNKIGIRSVAAVTDGNGGIVAGGGTLLTPTVTVLCDVNLGLVDERRGRR
jgi:hypothetical protein